MIPLTVRWQAPSPGYLAGLILGVCLLWLLGPAIGIAGHAPLASVTSRVIATLLVVLISELYRAHRATDEADFTRAHDNSEEGIMRQAFAGAVAFLRKTTLKNTAHKTSLFELPWHLMIGAPGSGKSTLIARADLKFVLAKKAAARSSALHKAVSQTRFCDWWVTRDAVILDTSGHFFLPDKHHPQYAQLWSRFLRLVKQARPRESIQSVTVTLNAVDLLRGDANVLAQQQQAFAQRIQDIQSTFDPSIPLHLVITQADHIAGFKEFFADQDEAEREQVWGLPLVGDHFSAEQSLNERYFAAFSTLLDQLNTRLIWRLHQSHQENKNALIKDFPLQMDKLRPVLGEFLKGLSEDTSDTQFLDAPALNLQGIYFTSSEQGTRSLNPLLAPLRKALDFPLMIKRKQAPRIQKHYFAHAMFKHRIFKPKEAEQKASSYTWLRALGIAALVTVMLTASLWVAQNFKQQNRVLSRVQSTLLTYQSLTQANGPASLEAAVAALNALQQAKQLTQQLQDPALANRAYRAYHTALNQFILIPLQARASDALQRALNQPKRVHRDYVPLYQQLQLALMTTGRLPIENQPLTLWLQQQLTEQNTLTPAEQHETRVPNHTTTKTLAQLQNFLQQALQQTTEAKTDDLDLKIVQARASLHSLSPTARAYVILQAHAPLIAPKLQLFTETNRNLRHLFHEAVEDIPYFYTANGFESVVVPHLGDSLISAVQGNLILGQQGATPSAPQMANMAQRILQTYTAEYVYYWKSLLTGLRLKKFDNLAAAQQALFALSGDEHALLNRMQVLSQLMQPSIANTVLEKHPHYRSLLTHMQTNLQAQLAPLKQFSDASLLTNLQNTLQALQSLIGTIQSAPDPMQKSFETVRNALLQSTTDNLLSNALSDTQPFSALAQLKRVAPKLPASLQPMMNHLLAGIWQPLLKTATLAINQAWQRDIWPTYQNISNRYPLLDNSQHDVSLKAFTQFFGPKGTLSQFSLHYILPFVETASLQNIWHWKKIEGVDLPLDDQQLAAIQKGVQIQKMFFPKDSPTMNLEFSLIARALSPQVIQFNLDLDGQMLGYPQGGASKSQLHWPGHAKQNSTIKLSFKRTGERQRIETYRGPWALFRLLDDALIEDTDDPKQFSVTLNLRDSAVKYKLIAANTLNPFHTNALKQFELKEQLIKTH